MIKLTKITWKCSYGCGHIITDEFYQGMIQEEKRLPICECRYGGIINQPWSSWNKIETLIEPETS